MCQNIGKCSFNFNSSRLYIGSHDLIIKKWNYNKFIKNFNQIIFFTLWINIRE